MALQFSGAAPGLPGIGEGAMAPDDLDLMLAALRQALTRPRGALAAPAEAEQIAEAAERAVGQSICEAGIGLAQALDVYAGLLSQQGVATDHPGYLAYIGAAPTPAAALMDGLLSASGMIGSGWLGGAGLIWAENQALRWLSDLAGLPAAASGCFVSGGTAGNFSALVAARQRYRDRVGMRPGLLLVADGAHSSIIVSARLLDLHVVVVASDETGRLTATALARRSNPRNCASSSQRPRRLPPAGRHLRPYQSAVFSGSGQAAGGCRGSCRCPDEVSAGFFCGRWRSHAGVQLHSDRSPRHFCARSNISHVAAPTMVTRANRD